MQRVIEMNNARTEYREIQTETWELIRIKNIQNKYNKSESYAYVLLQKRREGNNRSSDNFSVTIIPLVEVSEDGWNIFENSKSTWDVQAKISCQHIRFARSDNFQIRDKKLRGRGLGSYVLSDLVQWVKQYYPTYTIKNFSVKNLENKLKSDTERVFTLYKQVGFRIEDEDLEEGIGMAVAENASALHEHRNASKVESITIEKFLEIFREDRELQQAVRDYWRDKNVKLRKYLFYWQLVATVLFAITVISILYLYLVIHKH